MSATSARLLDKSLRRIPFDKVLAYDEIFERFRKLTTQREYLDLLSNERIVLTCCRYGFAEVSPNATAIRCLCNLLLQVESTRQIFVDGGCPEKAVQRMKIHKTNRNSDLDPDEEFTSARLLLFCTYKTTLDFNVLFKRHSLAEIIKENIIYYADCINDNGSSPPEPATRALTESLRLLYNLLSAYPTQIWRFQGVSLAVLRILHETSISSPPLQSPVSSLINTLLYLELDHDLFHNVDCFVYVDRLAHILDLATRSYPAEAMDSQASPLVQVLLRISEAASDSLKSHLRTLFLPSDEDREVVLGKGNSLPSRLLALFNDVRAPNLKELLPALYFDLSNKDATEFTRNVGYGLAAGHTGIDNASNAQGSRSDQGQDIPETSYGDLNPITGQRRDKEPQSSLPDMTEEEKEREAERLFVLFERLKKTGVMTVENPVARAVQEGRFEEIE
ncbi:guanine nucleotide exchange factor [Delphinella strobiligena]|nr:guanine nucleotide exchange factor [Delphinella strobiligena]